MPRLRGRRVRHTHDRGCGHSLSITELLWLLVEEMRELRVTNQEQLDDVAARLTALNDNMTAGVANIRQDIADLKAQPGAEQLDFTSLENSVAGLESTANSVTELADENPAPNGGPAPAEGEPAQG